MPRVRVPKTGWTGVVSMQCASSLLGAPSIANFFRPKRLHVFVVTKTHPDRSVRSKQVALGHPVMPVADGLHGGKLYRYRVGWAGGND